MKIFTKIIIATLIVFISSPSTIIAAATDLEIFASIDPARGIDLTWINPDDALAYSIWRLLPDQNTSDKSLKNISTNWIQNDIGYFYDAEAFASDRYGQELHYEIQFFNDKLQKIGQKEISIGGVYDLDSILEKATNKTSCPTDTGPGFTYLEENDNGFCILKLAQGVYELHHKINFYRERNSSLNFQNNKTKLHNLLIQGAGTDQTTIRPRQAFGSECKIEINGETDTYENLPITCRSFIDDRIVQFNFAGGGFQNLKIETYGLDYGIYIFNPYSDKDPDKVFSQQKINIDNVIFTGNQGIGLSDATNLRIAPFNSNNPKELQKEKLIIKNSIIAGFETGLDLSGGSPTITNNTLAYNQRDFYIQEAGVKNTDDWEKKFSVDNWLNNNKTDDKKIKFYTFPGDQRNSLEYLNDLRVIDNTNEEYSIQLHKFIDVIAQRKEDFTKQNNINSTSNQSRDPQMFADGTTHPNDFARVLASIDNIPANQIDVIADKAFQELRDNFKNNIDEIINNTDLASIDQPQVIETLNAYLKYLQGYRDPGSAKIIKDVCTQMIQASDLSTNTGSGDIGESSTSVTWVNQFLSDCEIRRTKEATYARNYARGVLNIKAQDELYRTTIFRLRALNNLISRAIEPLEKIYAALVEWVSKL